MTDADAKALKPGAVLVTTVLAAPRQVELMDPPSEPLVNRHGQTWGVIFRVRRVGERRNGGRFPVIKRYAEDLIPVSSRHDPDSAWIFADWLEERGQQEAAEMLRRAFPIAEGGAA